MDILATLGLNSTLFVQLTIFVLTYVVFSTLLFKPYLATHLMRASITDVDQTTPSILVGETKDITLKYEFKAREISDHINKVYDTARLEAQHEYDEVVKKAREEAERKLAQTRKEIEATVVRVRQELVHGVPGVSATISNKLLGKESEA